MSQDNFDQEIQDAQVANPDVQDHSENTEKTTQEAAPEIDWKEKFVNSQKGALELLEENKLLKSQQAVQEEFQGQAMESLYPGFEQLDSEAQANILAFSEGITKKAKEEFYKDPAIAFARKNYNETCSRPGRARRRWCRP